MQRAITSIIAGSVACTALVFAAVPTSASAMTAAASAVQYGQTNVSMVQKVHRYWRGRRYVRPYGHNYGYYGYPNYGYYQPYGYYRPYGYYGGYGYRPGVSLWFGF